MKAYKFGENVIKSDLIFYQTKFSFAFLNKKQLIEGHVLLCPKKITKRFTDLKINEIDQYLLDLQNVRDFLSFYYKKPIKMGIQDGKEAGQSVDHLHTHLIPCNDIKFITNSKRIILNDEQIKNLSEKYKNSMEDFFKKENKLKLKKDHLKEIS